MDSDDIMPIGCTVVILLGISTGCFSFIFASVGKAKQGISQAYEDAVRPTREKLADEVREFIDTQRELQANLRDASKLLADASTSTSATSARSLYDSIEVSNLNIQDSFDSLQRSVSRIDRLSETLGDEWRQELDQYKSANLKTESERRLVAAEQKSAAFILQAESVVATVTPAVDSVSDQTLFLKHNLDSASLSVAQTSVSSVISHISTAVSGIDSSLAASESYFVYLAAPTD